MSSPLRRVVGKVFPGLRPLPGTARCVTGDFFPGTILAVRALVTLAAAPIFVACQGPEPCPDVHYDLALSVPATDAVLTVKSRVSAHTDGNEGAVSVAIDDNLGTVTFPGESPAQAFIFDQIDSPGIQRTLYGGLALGDGSWHLFWLYCSLDGRLTYFWASAPTYRPRRSPRSWVHVRAPRRRTIFEYSFRRTR